MMPTPPLYLEHAEDVLGQWLTWRAEGPVALVMVTATIGGGVREPGALMAVNESGAIAGYVSGGCIDADVALQAQNAIKSGKPVSLRYGAGSPFTDLPLPCGGAIDIHIEPNADEAAIRSCHERLRNRKRAQLAVTADFTATYYPKLRLRIAGRGADSLALARLARASGITVELQLREGDEASAIAQAIESITILKTPSALPALHDDPWTAFILMFHDPDWEIPILEQALGGPAFHIGAVGSVKTQEKRKDALREAGLTHDQIRRVRGPVGLIPSMRDASMLAVSVLAEIVEAYHAAKLNAFASTALILLAAGQSSRFEEGDKLLAKVKGIPLLAHAANRLSSHQVGARLAVTGPEHAERGQELKTRSWTLVENPDAATGQASSLRAGLKAAKAIPGIDSALILLADMPDITDIHLSGLMTEFRKGRQAVMSEADDILSPPAIFADTCFDALCTIEGDTGAKSVFARLGNTSTYEMPRFEARDVDRLTDIMDRLQAEHG